jgi:nitrogen fixation/metabolism regulation signal transduction histidine kinase
MGSSPREASKSDAPAAAGARVGQFYLDITRQRLHCLNDAAHELLGEGVPFTSTDLSRQPLWTPEGKPVAKEAMPLVRALREGVALEAQFLMRREPLPPLHLRWSASPVRDGKSKIVGVLTTVIGGPPEPDWQALAGLAHDLRTPLQSLGLLVELAEASVQNPAEMRDLLPRIRMSAERATSIAQDLLDWCRGPARKDRAAERTWLALEPLLANLAAEMTIAAKHKSLVLVSNVAATRGWEAHTDRVRLGRLLSNLLVNAIRYTTTGQVEFTASWREDRSGRDGPVPGGHKLALNIVDTGAGIPLEEQESIFQPFERGRAGKEGDSGGSGLGLAVVDRLVEDLGLELEVYSEFGRGSAFHLLLPAAFLRQVSHD